MITAATFDIDAEGVRTKKSTRGKVSRERLGFGVTYKYILVCVRKAEKKTSRDEDWNIASRGGMEGSPPWEGSLRIHAWSTTRQQVLNCPTILEYLNDGRSSSSISDKRRLRDKTGSNTPVSQTRKNENGCDPPGGARLTQASMSQDSNTRSRSRGGTEKSLPLL